MKIQKILDRTLQHYQLKELEYQQMYNIRSFNLRINTPEGPAPLTHIIRKQEQQAIVHFEDGRTVDCSINHQCVVEGKPRSVSSLTIGNVIDDRDGTGAIISNITTGNVVDVYDISVDNSTTHFYTKNGITHKNTGKTFKVEQALAEIGMSDGNGYFKNTTSASAVGMYKTLYDYRDSIILFDDCDAVFKDQESRNLLKAATDTRASRKIGWNKAGAWLYKGDPASLEAKKDEKNDQAYDPFESDDADDGDKLYPRYFDFKGKIIFISNLQLDQLDPDGALRTRGFIMSINPTNDEIINFMQKIMNDIRLEGGLTLASSERAKVLEIVRSGKNRDEMNMRKLVRGMNMAAAKIPGWEQLVSRYA